MDLSYFDSMQRARKRYARVLEPICREWDLTRNELDVLLFLYNNPGLDRAADIVTHRGIAKSHVSLAVQNLESRQLLQRHFEPADRRNAHLRLSDAAAAIAQTGQAAQRQFFATLYSGISKDELALWRGIIEKVIQNIENMEE